MAGKSTPGTQLGNVGGEAIRKLPRRRLRRRSTGRKSGLTCGSAGADARGWLRGCLSAPGAGAPVAGFGRQGRLIGNGLGLIGRNASDMTRVLKSRRAGGQREQVAGRRKLAGPRLFLALDEGMAVHCLECLTADFRRGAHNRFPRQTRPVQALIMRLPPIKIAFQDGKTFPCLSLAY